MEGVDSPNREALVAVAEALRPFLDRVVFVGGQVAELLITDPAAVSVRPTMDVDVIMATGSRSEFRQLERELASLGFRNDISDGAPICRWIGSQGHRLDFMPVDDTILGFSNRWYPMATEAADPFQIGPDLSIRIPRAPVFVASKLAAFRSRGRDDLLASHDLEDVVAVVAGRPGLSDEVQEEAESLQRWLAEQISWLLRHPDFLYAVQGALPDAARMPGYVDAVLASFRRIAPMP